MYLNQHQHFLIHLKIRREEICCTYMNTFPSVLIAFLTYKLQVHVPQQQLLKLYQAENNFLICGPSYHKYYTPSFILPPAYLTSRLHLTYEYLACTTW